MSGAENRIYIHKELNLHKHLIIHTRLHAVRDVRIAPGAGLSDSAVTLPPRRKFIAGCFGGRSPGVRRASPPLRMTDRFPPNLVLLFPLNDDMSNISNILSNILVIRVKFVI